MHQYLEADGIVAGEGRGVIRTDGDEVCSLNTLGYSPIAFEDYMRMLIRMSRSGKLDLASSSSSLSTSTAPKVKPFIVSVSGTEEEVARCAEFILRLVNEPEVVFPLRDGDAKGAGLDLMMEINLSCPNIPSKPPPAYDGESLISYLTSLSHILNPVLSSHPSWKGIHVGIKTPPYTHAGQFQTLLSALEASAELEGGCPITFITGTNTLGSCLVLDSDLKPALGSVNGTGIGGLAGDALHPLSLGNVKTIRDVLDASKFEDVKALKIIGIGGVKDANGYRRMKSVGAAAVGVGTAFGREGVEVFEKITKGLNAAELK